MFATMFNKGALPVMEKAVSFHELRHRVIANNIANIETPFFKAKDLPVEEFRTLLRRAIRERDARTVPIFQFEDSFRVRLDARGHLSVDTVPSRDVDVMRHNENNVSIDREMVKLAQNTMLHNALVGMLATQFQVMEGAIKERPV